MAVAVATVPQLAYQTALAEKFIGDQHGDDGFFALVGNDGQLDLAFLEIEYGIRGIALRIHHLAFVILECRTRLTSALAKKA